MIIIGLCGKRRHGKDLIADYAVKEYGFDKLALADPMKEAIRAIFGFNQEQLYGSLKEQIDDFWGLTPREIFQVVGTHCMRKALADKLPIIGEDVWIKNLERRIQILQAKGVKRIIISDIREPFEAELIRKLEGKIIKIRRLDILENPTDQFAKHSSEVLVDSIQEDYLLESNTLSEKILKASDIFNKILVNH